VKTKLKLQPDPTFKAKVGIPVPGKPSHEVEFTFRHMSRDQLDEYLHGEGAKSRDYVDTVMGIATAWEGVDAPFDAESLRELFKNYMGAPVAILGTYGRELSDARLGN
jgi:Phage tail assembly chaperone